MDIKREEAFNEVIDKLDELGLLPYVMIMGSWAEILFILFLYYVSKVRIAGIRQDIKKIWC
jgi:hypothetical protein